jgi:hypothetical protein
MKSLLKSLNKVKYIFASFIIIASFFGCEKDYVAISPAKITVGSGVKSGDICGSIKGTMLSDSVYNVTCDIVVNAGDTLLIQPGAKIYLKGNYTFWIKGNLLSLGSQDKPIFFTVPNLPKNDVIGQDPTTDNAYKGSWGGLQADTSTKFMIIKWTHIEFAGGLFGVAQTSGTKNGGQSPPIGFVNPTGILVVEDSWIYGGVDGGASISPKSGQIHIMRNTLEKGGFTGGEAIGIGNGTQGVIAYNLIIGAATNAIKLSNGKAILSQTNVVMYNNTLLNGGYRRFLYGGAGNSLGRGASINIEGGAAGKAYNNLLVNNRFGLRIVGTASYLGNNLVIADTANCKYGHNYNYGDDVSITNQFYPTNFLTKPQPSDMPAPSSFLPSNYALGSVYDATSLVGQNDPQFKNYPLPIGDGKASVDTKLASMSFVGNHDFRLKSTSPCIGKGTTNFSLLNVVPIDPTYGATEATPPGLDIGCYQANGSGNKH